MLKNLKILTRLMILVGIMSLALIINSLYEFHALTSAQDNIRHLYEGNVEEIDHLARINEIYELDLLLPVFKVLVGKNTTAEARENIKTVSAKVEQEWDKFYARALSETDTNIKQQIQRVQPQIKNLAPLIQKLDEVLKQDDKTALANFSADELIPQTEQVINDNYQLILDFISDSKIDFESFTAQLQNFKLYAGLIAISSLILAILFATWIAFSITKPLSKAITHVNRFIKGDLELQSEEYTKDEVGQLRHAMEKMAFSSKNMADALTAVSNGDLSVLIEPRSEKDTLGLAILNMITKLRQIVGELKSEVAVLTSSSEEIVASVSQVASGSAETAAAVTETTTTVEELKQTSHVADEKSRDVLKTSEDTLQVVNSSEKSLLNTIEDMRLINEKMRIISEGIVKLSEHSQTIGDIIDTVNDLAEQSNLLAVNAAIEAAKAGEQGKSFGVVAQEIRTLAEQSKAATIQVRSILNDIQNSTSAAVLATEQGSKAVEKGVNQSSQTNELMQMLTQSITQVTQAANQIAISCQQQFVGIDQVTIAMNNISDATTQHVDHMKQIETAVISLNSVGKTLKEIIDQYNLEDESFHYQDRRQKGLKDLYKSFDKKKKPEHETSHV